MNAKDYLIKVRQICDKFESRGCNNGNCPLHKFACGLPDTADTDEVIKLVETFDLSKKIRQPKLCPHCGKEVK